VQVLWTGYKTDFGETEMRTASIVVLAALVPAAVQTDDETPISTGSCEIGAASQLELNTCATADLTAADEELNRVYREVLTRYTDDPLFRERLKTAQRAWLAFRDAELGAIFPHDREPGYYSSMFPYCRQSWLSLMTRQRTEELRRWLASADEGADICTGSFPAGDGG